MRRNPAGPAAGVLRMADANANRAGEGLRAVEDALRFARDDAAGSAAVRGVRHALVRLAERLGSRSARLAVRDSAGDVGARRFGGRRASVADLLAANFRRAEESCRVLEECGRLLGRPAAVRGFQRARYRLYDLERRLASGGR